MMRAAETLAGNHPTLTLAIAGISETHRAPLATILTIAPSAPSPACQGMAMCETVVPTSPLRLHPTIQEATPTDGGALCTRTS
jgi:hypothetical protein